MRPDALNPLFAETETLEGVGPKLKKPLARLGLTRIRDVAYHLPDRFVTRRAVGNLDEAGEGETIIVRLLVTEHRGGRSPRAPFRVLAQDGAGNVLALTYFGKASYSARKQLPVGEARWVTGKLERYGDMLQIVHPDHVIEEGGDAMGQLCEPVYGLSEGLTQPKIAALVRQASRGARTCRNGSSRALSHRKAGLPGARRSPPRTRGRTRARAIGWPMTSCSPTALP